MASGGVVGDSEALLLMPGLDARGKLQGPIVMLQIVWMKTHKSIENEILLDLWKTQLICLLEDS